MQLIWFFFYSLSFTFAIIATAQFFYIFSNIFILQLFSIVDGEDWYNYYIYLIFV